MEKIKTLVRPLISLAMAGGVLWGFVVGKIGPVEFIIFAAVCVYWWYQGRKKPPTTTIGTGN